MLIHILSNLFVRVLAEKAFENAFDKSTPGRVASILQGLTCTIMILQKQWKEAISLTLYFFIMDLVFEEIYKLPRHLEMKLHHVCGATLCALSMYLKTYEQKHIGSSLTYALICLETCNPLLHSLIIMKKEKQLHRLSAHVKSFLKILLISQFFLVRVVWLGYAFLRLFTYKLFPWQYSILVFAGALWIMQIFWFIKLIRNSN